MKRLCPPGKFILALDRGDMPLGPAIIVLTPAVPLSVCGIHTGHGGVLRHHTTIIKSALPAQGL
jgi:hypothetical protein